MKVDFKLHTFITNHVLTTVTLYRVKKEIHSEESRILDEIATTSLETKKHFL